MKLSDFGLSKPLECRALSTLNENEPMYDENLRDPMDIDGSIPNTDNGSRWRSPQEQLQHWQMNRRKLVCKFVLHNMESNNLYRLKIEFESSSF